MSKTGLKLNYYKNIHGFTKEPICRLCGTDSDWNDISGNNNNFTFFGSPSITNNVVTFNGTSNYAYLNTFNHNFITSTSIFFWIKTSQVNGTILSFGRTASNTTNILVIEILNGKLLFWDYNTGVNYDKTTVSTLSINDNIWHLVGLAKNGNTCTYYFDGLPCGTKSGSANILYNLNDVVIGRDNQNLNNYFNGSIKEFFVFDTVLNDNNSMHLFYFTKENYRTITKTNLLFWFDARNHNRNGTTVIDNSGNSNSGVSSHSLFNSSFTKKSDGVIDYFTFYGSTNISGNTIRSSNILTALSNSSWNQTQEVWFRTSTSNAGVIIDETDNTIGNTNWHDSQVEVHGGYVYFRVWSLTGFSNSSTVNDGKWHHAVWRYKSSGLLEGFIDGVKCSGSSVGTRTTPGSACYHWLGEVDWTNMGNGSYFNGDIALYRNYNSALTDEQILNNYHFEKHLFV